MTLAFAGITCARAKPATPATPVAPAIERKTETSEAIVLIGKVTSVDAKAGKLTIRTKDGETKLMTDSKNTRAALAKLKVGDNARVFEKGGKVIAASPLKTESKDKTAN